MISAEQRARRRNHLGSSDAATIFDLNPYSDQTELYWSKVAEVPDEQTDSTSAGNFLEPAICGWAAHRLGVEITPSVEIIREGQLQAANLDALINGRREAIEAKYCGDPAVAEQYGAEGSDQVPEHTLIQAQHQMYVGELERVWVAVLLLIRRAEFRIYTIERHDGIIGELVTRENEWWERHVVPRIPPDGNPVPPLAALKAIGRRPKSIEILDDEAIELWHEYERLGKAAKAIGDDREQVQAKILSLLRDAEAGALPDGRMLTYLSQKSARRCDYDMLRALSPQLYDQLVTQGEHRVLRITKANTTAVRKAA